MNEDVVLFNASGQRLFLDAKERLALMQAAQQTQDEMAGSFCLLLLQTGCRISEAINLTRGSVNLKSQAVTFHTLKRQTLELRTVPLSPGLITTLVNVHKLTGCPNQNNSTMLWPYSRTTAWRRIKGFMEAAGIEGAQASPKGLRHGFGIACVEQQIPVTMTQKWLGHASAATTAHYWEITGSNERTLAHRLWAQCTPVVHSAT